MPQLPANPAYLRVKVWRRLQALGAVPLKNGVHALPLRADTRTLFEELKGEITANGGEAFILEASLAGGISDADLRGMFDAARDEEYDELVREARALVSNGNNGKGEVARLRKRLAEIAAIDFFGAHSRQAAEAAINETDSSLHRHPDVSGAAVDGLPPFQLRNRVWVTRRDIHVDRIASAWLIRKFIDPQAQFKFVETKSHIPAHDELRFDMAGAEFTHDGDQCTFETLIRYTALDSDKALRALSEIVHDLDTADEKFGRIETAGVAALISGICAVTQDDTERLARGSSVFDGLYTHFSQGSGG